MSGVTENADLDPANVLVLVINLDRSPERWKRWQHFKDVTRVSGVDGKLLDIAAMTHVPLSTRARILQRVPPATPLDMSVAGELGCIMSHVKALRMGEAAPPHIHGVFILEDDLVLPAAWRGTDRIAPHLCALARVSSWAPEARSIHAGIMNVEPFLFKLRPGTADRIQHFNHMAAVYYPREGIPAVLAQLQHLDSNIDELLSSASALSLLDIRADPNNQMVGQDYNSTILHKVPLLWITIFLGVLGALMLAGLIALGVLYARDTKRLRAMQR